MSYILDALKKSQQERELGHVPTLDDAPYLHEQRPARSTYWVIVAMVLALLAVLIALYAAFGTRLLQDRPESLVTTTKAPEAIPPATPATEPPAEVIAPAKPPTVTKPAPKTAPAVAKQPAKRPQPMPAPVRPAPKPAPAVETQAASTLQLPPIGPAIPPDLVGDVQRFKQEILRQGPTAEKRAERPVPEKPPVPVPPVPEKPPVVPPDPVATVPAEVETPSAQVQAEPQSEAPPPAPEAGSAPEFADLSPAEQAGIPPHRLSVHVYASDPAQRFVILNSRKMHEGDRTGKGLAVATITADGVILEYSGKRFFVHR